MCFLVSVLYCSLICCWRLGYYFTFSIHNLTISLCSCCWQRSMSATAALVVLTTATGRVSHPENMNPADVPFLSGSELAAAIRNKKFLQVQR